MSPPNSLAPRATGSARASVPSARLYFDTFLEWLRDEAGDTGDCDEWSTRRLVEPLALALQAALLVQHAPNAVADAFCTTRRNGDWGRTYGTLPREADAGALLERAFSPVTTSGA